MPCLPWTIWIARAPPDSAFMISSLFDPTQSSSVAKKRYSLSLTSSRNRVSRSLMVRISSPAIISDARTADGEERKDQRTDICSEGQSLKRAALMTLFGMNRKAFVNLERTVGIGCLNIHWEEVSWVLVIQFGIMKPPDVLRVVCRWEYLVCEL